MRSNNLRRREVLTLFGGVAAGWTPVAYAQQPRRVKRIGILIGTANDALTQSNVRATLEFGLQELGWSDGRNLQIEYRWAQGNPDRIRAFAKELVDLAPDLIVAEPTPAVAALKQHTRTIPIVFVAVSDPIRAGFVESFSRPGGNITGFTIYETTLGGKWLQLLHELAPSVERVAMLFNPETAGAGASGGVYLQSIEAAAHATGIELIVTPVHKPDEIDGALAGIAQEPGGGLIVTPNAFTVVNRHRIASQATRLRIPAIYPSPRFVEAGGLASYGTDVLDIFRRAASYVDRILKGEEPADLPVQAPVKFQLVINLGTAKALGLTVPPRLYALADEVIE
jgi:putative tryptophan/tyrosine transport system substrate-binding protein